MIKCTMILMKLFVRIGVLSIIFLSCSGGNVTPSKDGMVLKFQSVYFKYSEITGIGHEHGITRRDPSDIIKVGDTWFVYYTKVIGKSPGYWGTIWYATSGDEGRTWKEQGEALGIGEPGTFDSFGTFTPNIYQKNHKYYLFFTGVKPTQGRMDGSFENNSFNDITAIGLATSEYPNGPFKRISYFPVLEISPDSVQFDSYRVDDAAILERNGKILLYYKGRSKEHGIQGPAQTKMSVAVADNPAGPFKKHPYPVLPDSHEVLVWHEGKGVAALASISSTIEYATDGFDFMSNPLHLEVQNRPNAPGLFRPEISNPEIPDQQFKWGISMIHNGSECYLVRFECIKE